MPALLNLITQGFQKAYNLPTIHSELLSTRALAWAPVLGETMWISLVLLSQFNSLLQVERVLSQLFLKRGPSEYFNVLGHIFQM